MNIINVYINKYACDSSYNLSIVCFVAEFGDAAPVAGGQPARQRKVLRVRQKLRLSVAVSVALGVALSVAVSVALSVALSVAVSVALRKRRCSFASTASLASILNISVLAPVIVVVVR